MSGPTIISAHPESAATSNRRSRFEGQSGVFWSKDSRAWVAIKAGRWAGEHRGKRGFLAAARAAGSDRRLA